MSFLSDKSKGLIQLAIVVFFVIFSFALSGMLQSKKPIPGGKNDQDRTIFVETQKVLSGNHQIQFRTTGVIESLTDIDVVPQISGQIIAVNDQFYEGGQFEKHEVLFEIDPRDFQLEVERLEAEVARAETSLTLEKAESSAAISEWEQFNGDQAVPRLVARKPQLAEAKANLKAANAQLKKAKLDLERTKIKMPFNGRVLSSIVANGRFVSAGQNVAQVFDMNGLEVRSSLTDQQLKWLLNEEQTTISITATHLGEIKTYNGFLKRSSAVLDTATRFATVSFGFESADWLLPGIFVNVDIKGPKLENVTRIPATAIQKGNIIWAVNPESRLVEIRPNIVYSNDSYIAVSGLNKEVNVVTSRLEGGADGIKVSTTSANGSAIQKTDVTETGASNE